LRTRASSFGAIAAQNSSRFIRFADMTAIVGTRQPPLRYVEPAPASTQMTTAELHACCRGDDGVSYLRVMRAVTGADPA